MWQQGMEIRMEYVDWAREGGRISDADMHHIHLQWCWHACIYQCGLAPVILLVHAGVAATTGVWTYPGARGQMPAYPEKTSSR